MNAKPVTSASLERRYADALGAYLRSADESALLQGYELGRQIMDNGGGVLDLSAVHQSAFERLAQGPERPGRQLMVQRAYEFLAECLSPFEMAQRGFREANLRLLSANEQLAQQAADLASANAELESSNRAIDRERATLAAVIASITEGLVVADASGRITAANARVAELLGVARESLIGQDVGRVAEVLAERCPDHPALRRLVARLDSPGHHPVTIEVRTAAPARDLQVELFKVRGTPEAGIGIMLRDVTAERDLARAKDELVAVVSHELRGPLANMIGFAELLLGDERLEESAERYVEIIAGEGHRLADLITEFLDLQRIDRGAETIHPQELDLGPLIGRLPAMFSDDETHALRLGLPPRLPTVWADPERIWQVLVNLVSNARKYSPQGGPIDITAQPSLTHVEVSVADRGLGIPADALPNLFGEFYRVPTPDRRGIPGTGLGLSICRKIIAAHHGEIRAESDGPGRGARFSFTLPTSGGPAASPPS
ncbi:MAG TPA: ATP-binding protein [Solirubrobacteraceae bacterium]|nr:ATP-binding protein [Solirubrobacteraceae bacterium]